MFQIHTQVVRPNRRLFAEVIQLDNEVIFLLFLRT
jgi:hypothetical protein